MVSRYKAAALLFVVEGATLTTAGCGSTSGDELGPDGARPGASAGEGGAGNGGDARSGSFVAGGDDATTFITDTGSPAPSFVGCAVHTDKATPASLDLYFMLDTSASMDDLVAAGQSKWASYVSAMNAFVNDPASAGIGVGLQYFPLVASGVPASCTSSAQCGNAGPCFLHICNVLVNGALAPCDTNADCGRQLGPCVPIGGFCENDPNLLCPTPGTSCNNDPNGFPLGMCQPLTTSYCLAGDSCAAQDYASPAVPIAPLPGSATTIAASLTAHQPQGRTPTPAALQGAINQAQTYARANAGHTVVAVLATDGIPDECIPASLGNNATIAQLGQYVAQLAAAGLSNSPSIKTFAIGVFAPNDVASGTSALDAIASAGGTGQAFIINSSTQNVEQAFSSALSAIRGASLPCQYRLPTPDGGTPDFNKLNVQYTAGTGAVSTVAYVSSPSGCDAKSGGWYYDTSPADGGTPSSSVVCPATCTMSKGDSMGRVDVVLGCQTYVR